MYILRVQGIRRSTLAYHRSDSLSEIEELVSVYLALGYKAESLIVDEHEDQQAA